MSNPNSPVNPAPKASSAVDPSVRQKIQAAKTALKDDLKDVNVSQAASAHAKLNDLADKNPNTPVSRLMGRLPGAQAKSYTTVASKVPTSQLDPAVPLTKFRNTLRAVQTADQAAKKAAQAAEKAANESIEFLDKEQVSEMMTNGNEQNPPAVIVLRRRGIRIFPDGKRVALYENKQLGLVFTIPYVGKGLTPTNVPSVTTEEAEKIDEVSHATLTSYVDKAKKSADELAAQGKYKQSTDRRLNIITAQTKQIGKRISDIKKSLGEDIELDEAKRQLSPEAIAKIQKALERERKNDKPGMLTRSDDKTRKNYSKSSTLNYFSKTYSEEVELDENLDALAKISKSGKPGKVKFKDGTTTDVHPQVAGVIHQLHGALNDENKKKVERMISHSAGQFDKIADFAVSKSEWKINK